MTREYCLTSSVVVRQEQEGVRRFLAHARNDKEVKLLAGKGSRGNGESKERMEVRKPWFRETPSGRHSLPPPSKREARGERKTADGEGARLDAVERCGQGREGVKRFLACTRKDRAAKLLADEVA